jgi:hypothetical protein
MSQHGWPLNSCDEKISQGRSPCRGCRSYSAVCEWHIPQLGPLPTQPIHGGLKRHAGPQHRVPLLVATHVNCVDGVERTPIFIFLQLDRSMSRNTIHVTEEKL